MADPGSRLVWNRTLRDDDDISGQTIRSWQVTLSDGMHVELARDEYSDWLSLRVDDLPRLIADLQEVYDRAKRVPAPRITGEG